MVNFLMIIIIIVYYILFPNVQTLYPLITTAQADGLCYQLTKACPKEPEAIPFKDLEVDRSEIEKRNKLGAGQFGEVWSGWW